MGRVPVLGKGLLTVLGAKQDCLYAPIVPHKLDHSLAQLPLPSSARDIAYCGAHPLSCSVGNGERTVLNEDLGRFELVRRHHPGPYHIGALVHVRTRSWPAPVPGSGPVYARP